MSSATKLHGHLRAIPGGKVREASSASTAHHHHPSEPSGAPSDDELIDAVIRGDDRTAALLYDRVIGVVDRTLYRIFGCRETDHDDLVQSTFEQIVITLCRQRFARACSLTTWAASVATHIGLNALRSRRRERKVLDHHQTIATGDAASNDDDNGMPPRSTTTPASATTAGEAAIEARFALERLRRHLSAMDPNKAEALFLHDALGHDLAEISVLTGVSISAAQSRLVRARKELMLRIETDNSIQENGGRRK